MSRKIVFVNALSSTLTISSDGPLVLTSIEGLGTPETRVQEQKAPFQDGTTYIDALFDPRIITIEMSINAPNDFADIDTYRRELATKMNPKLGMGTLTYTTENGAQYAISAIPVTSPLFPNKDYRDPFSRVMLTFHCPNPYWKKITSSTITLPTPITGAEVAIHSAVAGGGGSVIQLTNGNLFCVYSRAADGYLVSRTYTTSWGAEQVVNGASSGFPSVILLANGNLFVAYANATPRIAVRWYTGGTWGASETVISAVASTRPSACQLANGHIVVAYERTTAPSIVTKTYISSWGAEVTVDSVASSGYPSIIQLDDGNMLCAYVKVAGTLVTKEFAEGASPSSFTETTVNSAATLYPCLSMTASGDIVCSYTRVSDNYLCRRIFTELWNGESVINAAVSYYISVILLANGNTFMAYKKADNSLVGRTRSVTPVAAVVAGDVDTPILVTFNGPSVNPRIINQGTGEWIWINATLATGDLFVVNTAFGQKTVSLTQGGIVTNGIAHLDISSTFFSIEVGSNTVYYEDDAVLSTASVTMTWTERYVGI